MGNNEVIVTARSHDPHKRSLGRAASDRVRLTAFCDFPKIFSICVNVYCTFNR